MVQTSDGYLWFGTFNGLVRFDGATFTVFDPGNTPQLPSVGIVNLHLDRHERLWVSTYGGLVVHEGAQWRAVSNGDIMADDYIRTFTERPNGDLLLTTFNGKIFEFVDGRLTQLPTPPGEIGGGYYGYVDEERRWWAIQSKFIGLWNGHQWVATISTNFNYVREEGVVCSTAQDGGLWLLLGSELRKYSRGVEVSRRQLPETPGSLWSMSEDSRGNLWICTSNKGLCQILPNGRLQRWTETSGIYHGVRFVFEDREQNRWVGTSGGGLVRLKPRLFRTFDVRSGLSEPVVKSVWPAPEGGVWIGTYGQGLFRFGESGITNVPLPGWNSSGLFVQSVLTDRQGRTWVGTYRSGLLVLDREGVRHVPESQTGGDNVIALFEDANGRIWISGGKAVGVFEAGAFRSYGSEQGLPIGGVWCFAQAKDGALWLAHRQGVFRLQQDRFVEVLDDRGKPFREITCLKSDDDATMWMGSLNHGLIRWRDDSQVTIGAEAGLPALTIGGILEDDEGFFWMPSNRGVLRIKRRDLQSAADGRTAKLPWHLFDMNDGLASVDCPRRQQPVCARDAVGRLWFATLKGVAMADPTRFHANTVPPPVQIEEVLYHLPARGTAPKGQPNQRVVSHFSHPLVLPAGTSRVEVHYTAPSFVAPDKVQFQIRFGDDGAEWQDMGNRRVAYFDQVQPGKLAFQVRAANDDGLWNETGASLAIIVLPHFWQTHWFRGLIAFAALAEAILILALLRETKRRRQITVDARNLSGRVISAQEDERARLGRDLHDDLSQNLALLSVNLDILGQHPPESPEAVRARMRELSDQVKDLSSEVHRLSHEMHPLKLERLGLEAALRGFCRDISAAYRVGIQFNARDLPRVLPEKVALCMYRIAQEAIQNVIKHSGSASAEVELNLEVDEIRLRIADQGQGFEVEATKPGKSLGLLSMRERVRLLKGRISVESKKGAGATVEVSLPLKP